MKKVVFIALVALGVGFGGEFSYEYEICKNTCAEKNGICVEDWASDDNGIHGDCKRYFEEQKQKCINKCRLDLVMKVLNKEQK